MCYPAAVAPGTVVEQPFQMVDLMPTLLEAAGAAQPQGIDGRSVWAQLTKGAAPVHRDLYFEFGYARALMSDSLKYISFRYPDSLRQLLVNGEVNEAFSYKGALQDEPCFSRYPHYFDEDQLYQVKADYGEQNNLAYDSAFAKPLVGLKQKLSAVLSTFAHPYPSVMEQDPFRRSATYQRLVDKAKAIDMNQYYWYRGECY
ncbi:MAG: hypothetical protein HC842_09225 [Cytophagales bacterium]|nr:hypothetical protein [Cytophagales bacterium]